MSKLLPCKRKDFIKRLHKLEFTGPYSGTRHQFMVYQEHRLAIPSNKEYSIPQLKMLLKEIENIINREITLENWNNF